jgi:streptomycin 6-kinase
MLIERCAPGTTLATCAELDQDVVIATLLRRLWRPPSPGRRFRPLQQMCDQWADAFEAEVAKRGTPLDPGLARAGIELFRTLPSTSDRGVLLCTDLHAENVLAVGDPTYDPLQHMLNCERRLHEDPRGFARRMAGLLDLDAERLLLWLFARCVEESADWPQHAEVARNIAPG